MFLIIPLILILVSAGGIFFIIWRKLSRLQELAEIESSNGSMGDSGWRFLAYDLCPEACDWVRSIKVKEYTQIWLVEAEKFLRRLRLASLKMDRFSGFLIKKIRKRTYSGNSASFSVAEIGKDKQEIEIKTDEKSELKKSEQGLIIEISKNPKNAALYEELGDLYTKMGESRDAKESYEAAIELNSNSEELKKKLSQALEKLNHTL